MSAIKSKRNDPLVLLLLLAVVLAGGAAYYFISHLEPSVITVSYVPNDDSVAHRLDLYRPPLTKDPSPLILWLHGGGWLVGSKEDSPAQVFVKDGWALASMNYRFSDQAIFPAQLDDAKAAVRFLRAHAKEYNIRADKIGVFGMSAGGHLAALLGTTNDIRQMEGDLGNPDQLSSVEAVCDWCGPTDLLTIGKQAGKDNELDLNSPKGPVALLLGGLPKDKPELAKRASPITHVVASNPPILIMHGDADDMVPIQQSEEFYKALKAAGVKAEFFVVKGGRHNFATLENFQRAKEFFDRELR